MPTVEDVLIVGGGIAGMTLGIGLERARIRCEIAELNPQWTGPGTGISLQGPALRALRTLGLLERCIERGFGYSQLKTCDAAGNVIGTVELPSLLGPGYPATIGIMRQTLHRILQEVLAEAGVPVHLGITVSALTQAEEGVDVQFTDGRRARYGLVVGADGALSQVRDLVFGTQFSPRYTGQVNWRATVNRPPEVEGRYSYYGPRNKAGFNPVSRGQMYIYIVQNVPERPRWTPEHLPQIMREQLADFGGVLGRAREEIVAEHVIYRPVTTLLLPPPWHRGRVVVIGDAAHTTTPHLASGAGIAIEDSIVLALLLQSEQPLAEVLESFMRRRYERCRMVVENSVVLGEWEKNPNAPNADHVGLLDKSLKALAQPI